MEDSIFEMVTRLIDGDISVGTRVYTLAHDQIVNACRGAGLTLARCGVVKVLRDLAENEISEDDAQRWASFVRRGYVAGHEGGPISPIHIEYEPEFEDAIVEVLSRLDDLGDLVDGHIARGELGELLSSLQPSECA